jgi:hypothetical protein
MFKKLPGSWEKNYDYTLPKRPSKSSFDKDMKAKIFSQWSLIVNKIVDRTKNYEKTVNQIFIETVSNLTLIPYVYSCIQDLSQLEIAGVILYHSTQLVIALQVLKHLTPTLSKTSSNQKDTHISTE